MDLQCISSCSSAPCRSPSFSVCFSVSVRTLFFFLDVLFLTFDLPPDHDPQQVNPQETTEVQRRSVRGETNQNRSKGAIRVYQSDAKKQRASRAEPGSKVTGEGSDLQQHWETFRRNQEDGHVGTGTDPHSASGTDCLSLCPGSTRSARTLRTGPPVGNPEGGATGSTITRTTQ